MKSWRNPRVRFETVVLNKSVEASTNPRTRCSRKRWPRAFEGGFLRAARRCQPAGRLCICKLKNRGLDSRLF